MAMPKGKSDPKKSQEDGQKGRYLLNEKTDSLTFSWSKVFRVYKGPSHIPSSQKVWEVGAPHPLVFERRGT